MIRLRRWFSAAAAPEDTSFPPLPSRTLCAPSGRGCAWHSWAPPEESKRAYSQTGVRNTSFSPFEGWPAVVAFGRILECPGLSYVHWPAHCGGSVDSGRTSSW